MTAPTARPHGSPVETIIRLGFDETIAMDVRYCDLVLGRDPSASYEVRFRGARRPEMSSVRLFVPLEEIEGPLVHEGLLRTSIAFDPQAIDRTNSQEVKLEKYALRIMRQQTGRGRWRYQVQAIDGGASDHGVQQFLAAIQAAAAHIAPALKAAGYSVGAAEIISIAGQLDAMRHSQR